MIQEIKEKLIEYHKGIQKMEMIENKKITLTIVEMLNFTDSFNKTMDDLEFLISYNYDVSFGECASTGQQKLNDLMEEYIKSLN